MPVFEEIVDVRVSSPGVTTYTYTETLTGLRDSGVDLLRAFALDNKVRYMEVVVGVKVWEVVTYQKWLVK